MASGAAKWMRMGQSETQSPKMEKTISVVSTPGAPKSAAKSKKQLWPKRQKFRVCWRMQVCIYWDLPRHCNRVQASPKTWPQYITLPKTHSSHLKSMASQKARSDVAFFSQHFLTGNVRFRDCKMILEYVLTHQIVTHFQNQTKNTFKKKLLFLLLFFFKRIYQEKGNRSSITVWPCCCEGIYIETF